MVGGSMSAIDVDLKTALGALARPVRVSRLFLGNATDLEALHLRAASLRRFAIYDINTEVIRKSCGSLVQVSINVNQ